MLENSEQIEVNTLTDKDYQLLDKFENSSLCDEEKEIFRNKFETNSEFREIVAAISAQMALYETMANKNPNGKDRSIKTIALISILIIAGVSTWQLFYKSSNISNFNNLYGYVEDIPSINRSINTDNIYTAAANDYFYAQNNINPEEKDSLFLSAASKFRKSMFLQEADHIKAAYQAGLSYFNIADFDNAEAMFLNVVTESDNRYLISMSKLRLLLIKLDNDAQSTQIEHLKNYLRENKDSYITLVPKELDIEIEHLLN